MTEPKIPDKLFFRIGEVCQITNLQSYVIRYWETEFPQLSPQKTESGQRIYSKKDIEVIFAIKKLLYDEGFTIQGAKKKMESWEANQDQPLDKLRDDEVKKWKGLLQEILKELYELKELLS